VEGTERSKADHERSHPHPVRSAIQDLLPAGGEHCPSTVLAAILDLPVSRIGYHARVLVDLGLLAEPGPGVYRSPAP
jgi:DNA-binding transcriptional ArsR family regulator